MKTVSLSDGLESLYVLLLESLWQDYRQANAIGYLQPHGLAEVLQGLLRGIRGIAIEDGFDDNIARSGIPDRKDIDLLSLPDGRDRSKQLLGEFAGVAHCVAVLVRAERVARALNLYIISVPCAAMAGACAGFSWTDHHGNVES